jgi:hypothetical protein
MSGTALNTFLCGFNPHGNKRLSIRECGEFATHPITILNHNQTWVLTISGQLRVSMFLEYCVSNLRLKITDQEA